MPKAPPQTPVSANPRVLVALPGQDAQPWVQALQAALPAAQLQVWQDHTPAATGWADWALVWRAPQAFFDAQPQLRAIFAAGAGVDALLRLRLPAHARVFRLLDAGMGAQMAEYVAQGVARFCRGLAQAEADLAQGRWRVPPLRRPADCRVGVLGLGVLGQQVALTLSHAGYPVQVWSRSAHRDSELHTVHGPDGLDALLARSDVLVNVLPLTAQTENLLDAHRLAQLPRGAYLINVARGAHVVDADLVTALRAGQLSGALLDVFRQEPLPPEHPFLHTPGLTCTPHLSARTLLDESVAQIAQQARAYALGLPVAGEVDLQRGY